MNDIIVSSKQLQVGGVYKGLSDPRCHSHPNIAMLVLRTATEQEYHACLAEYGVTEEIPFFEEVWFYEVSID